MAHVQVHDDIALSDPVLVDGLPGVGLVGKLAADHLVEQYGMSYYASCHCEGLPEVAVYGPGDHAVRPPVRLYADADRDLLALQSDVPVSPNVAREFASCVTGWLLDHGVTPLYASGITEEKDGVPDLYGIGTGAGGDLLDDHDVAPPTESGLVSGPTGALLAAARDADLTGACLVVQTDPQFPDPEAARVLLERGIAPIAGIDVDTAPLADHADQIAEARRQLAEQMREADDESTRAKPLGMYQ
jgi:uncharacterized protein